MNAQTSLRRTIDDRMLCGVAGGIAKYLDVDVGLVRLAWVVLACATFGVAAICYAVLCAIMPSAAVDAPSDSSRDPRDDAALQKLGRPGAKDLNDEARLLLEVRRELGPEYEEELVESFVDKVEDSMKGRRAGQTHARSVDRSETSSSRQRRNMLLIGMIAVGAFLIARYIGLI
jgi:phage shock protein C